MKKTNNPPLVVYKASAGSGKTFTLAVEYIKLLIINPQSFRNTLAVTFTNKATEEMKLRILSQLNGLAHGYSDSADYMAKITQELDVDESLVQERASIALHSLIHNYDYFRVETIDKFFQRVLKNLARELDLSANLHVELNDSQIEQIAVDNLIDSLDNNNKILGWIMNFIMDNIGEDKSWNIIGQIKKFGYNIFKDIYKSHREGMQYILSDENFFNEFKTDLIKLKETNKQAMKKYGQQFFDTIGSLTSLDFFQGPKGVYGYFDKLRTGQFDGTPLNKFVEPCLDNAESWCKKKNPNRDAIINLVNNSLMELLNKAESDRKKCHMMIKSADVTLSHLNQLRLLGNIEDVVRRINSDNNRFLLSDTQGMLNALIDDSDTPFIFEKIGSNLKHIMIDEFQDTGALQWSNFKILLDECMHQGSSNLIVGDVKQSIYRWRSGDWRLLNNITSQFKNSKNLVKVSPLDTNYRSCRKIVDFNNKFFSVASMQEYMNLSDNMGVEAEQLLTAYSDVVQKVPTSKPDMGYVHVEIMSKEEYDKNIMEKIAETIQLLTENGVEQKDIAILARRNSDIETTAHYFQTNMPSINIVSDEAFRLDSSIAVRVLITALKVLTNEKDILSKCYLAKTYQNHILGNAISEDMLMFAYDPNDQGNAFSKWLPEGFKDNKDMALLRSMPMIDLVEKLYNIFNLNKSKGQSAYLCTFFDILKDYLSDNISDIDRFLEAWEEKYASHNIHGDDVDGVRMVTIHKSKGLEFENVLLPFCNWSLEPKSDIIWCQSTIPPFNQLPIIPVKYSKKQMKDTVFEHDYQIEHLQNTVDNLNLLYVAFTRARTRLFVYGIKKKKDEKKGEKKEGNRSELIEQCLPLLLKPSEASTPNGKIALPPLDGNLKEDDNGNWVFKYGKCFNELNNTKRHNESENIFLMTDENENFQIKSYPTTAKFLQSNESKTFVDTDEKEFSSQYIQRGNLLHFIFSKIKYLEDIDRVVQELSFRGIIGDEISHEELNELLQQAFSHPQVRDWFSKKWTIHSECNILYKENEKLVSLRPDRVMSNDNHTVVIDFKFGKPDLYKHKNQVKRYMKLLKKMGHEEIEGYIWYVFADKIEKV